MENAVVNKISKAIRAVASLSLVAALALPASFADAQTRSQQGRDKGVYTPTIWATPMAASIGSWMTVSKAI